jgi:hypothetical protein
MTQRAVDAGVSALDSLVRSQIEKMDVDAGLKSLLIYIVDNGRALIDFSIEYSRQKSGGKITPDELMIAFLKSRGESLAQFGITFIDNETIADLAALLDFLRNAHSSLKYSSTGPIGVTLTVGFLVNHFSVFLCNFTPAQRAFYELFLKKAEVRVHNISPRFDQDIAPQLEQVRH